MTLLGDESDLAPGSVVSAGVTAGVRGVSGVEVRTGVERNCGSRTNVGDKKVWTFSDLSPSPLRLQSEHCDTFKPRDVFRDSKFDPWTELEDRTELWEEEEEEEESRERGKRREDGMHSHVSRSENLE